MAPGGEWPPIRGLGVGIVIGNREMEACAEKNIVGGKIAAPR